MTQGNFKGDILNEPKIVEYFCYTLLSVTLSYKDYRYSHVN